MADRSPRSLFLVLRSKDEAATGLKEWDRRCKQRPTRAINAGVSLRWPVEPCEHPDPLRGPSAAFPVNAT
jgi:hypothetical protein